MMFGPFEKPSAPAFSVHAEIRALCCCVPYCMFAGWIARRVKLSVVEREFDV